MNYIGSWLDNINFLLNFIAGHINDNMSPILLVSGTLIALTVVRNNHLSDRPRQNTDELLYKLPISRLIHDDKERRRESLACQNAQFIKRYKNTANAIVASFLSLFLFVLVSVLYVKKGAEMQISLLDKNTISGILTFGYSVSKMIREFRVGKKTLARNNEAMTYHFMK